MRKLALLCCTAFALALVAAPARAVVTGTTTEVSYTGNGSTTVYPFSFKATDKAWVKVFLGGVAQASGFTVTLNTNQDSSPGGSVTFTDAPTSGVAVKLERTLPLTQELVLQAYTPFPAKAIAQTLDRLVMQGQQVDARVAKAEATHAADKAAWQAADVTLQANIDAEEAARAAGDSAASSDRAAIRAQFAAADATEASARASEDASIRAQLASAALGGGVNIADTSTVLATGDTQSRQLKDIAADIRAMRAPGVRCDGSDETALVQAALNLRGHIRIPCTVRVTAPLTIYSDTHLELAPGATIKNTATNGPTLLRNYAYLNPVRTTTDAAMTSGSAVLTSSTAAFTSADVGRAVVVIGALATGAPLTANVVSVQSATQATLSVTAGSNVAAASLKVYDRDKNITISGGRWETGAPGGVVTRTGVSTFIFRRVDGLTIRDTTMQIGSGEYVIYPGDVTTVTIERVKVVSAADCIHVSGPARFIAMRDLDLDATDDTIAFTVIDTTSKFDDVAGEWRDVVIENVTGTTETATLLFCGGANLEVGHAVARNVRQTQNTYGAITFCGAGSYPAITYDTYTKITDVTLVGTRGKVQVWADEVGTLAIKDTVHPVGAGLGINFASDSVRSLVIDGYQIDNGGIGDTILKTAQSNGATTVISNLSVSNVQVQRTTGTSTGSTLFALLGNNITNATFTDIRADYSNGGFSTAVIGIYGTVGKLTVNGMRIACTGANTKTHGIQVAASGASLGSLLADNLDFTFADTSTSTGVGVLGSGILSSYSISNVRQVNGTLFIDAASTTGTLGAGMVSNASITTPGRFANIQTVGGTDLTLTGIFLNAPSFAAIYANQPVTIRGAGFRTNVTLEAGVGWGTTEGPGPFHIKNQDFPADIEQAAVAKANGNKAINTRSGISVGWGPVVSNGTSWKNVYSGATY